MNHDFRVPTREIPPNACGPGWTIQFFGDPNLYLIKRNPTEYIATTGAQNNVDTELEIPYPHRFCHIENKETDTTPSDDTTAHSLYFARYKWSGNVPPFLIYSFVNSVSADNELICGEGYEFPPGKYRLRLNGDANHWQFFQVIIQILSKKGPEYPGVAQRKDGWEY